MKLYTVEALESLGWQIETVDSELDEDWEDVLNNDGVGRKCMVFEAQCIHEDARIDLKFRGPSKEDAEHYARIHLTSIEKMSRFRARGGISYGFGPIV